MHNDKIIIYEFIYYNRHWTTMFKIIKLKNFQKVCINIF